MYDPLKVFLRHRVVPERSPRVAFAEAPKSEPGAFSCAMDFHRLERISRATGLEPTAPNRTEQKVFRGRKQQAITADANNEDELCGIAHAKPAGFPVTIRLSEVLSKGPFAPPQMLC